MGAPRQRRPIMVGRERSRSSGGHVETSLYLQALFPRRPGSSHCETAHDHRVSRSVRHPHLGGSQATGDHVQKLEASVIDRCDRYLAALSISPCQFRIRSRLSSLTGTQCSDIHATHDQKAASHQSEADGLVVEPC
jgi:hypothetical protein